ncbi:TolC family protein [Dendrosporobacter sp. 1207_IL3150]|uniref:TolC family protein n=1 Tax=Dendrosporobacter sp. 1207_IL3150 TaxID=3084054 RepID=UPI002FDB284A
MLRKNLWKKHITSLLAGGYLLLNTAAVFAAPVELSLDESIELALKNNPAIKIAQADKEKASWGINEAKSSKQPSVTLKHTSSRADNGVSAVGNDFSNTVNLSLPIYTGGKTEGLIDQAKTNSQSVDLGLEKTKQQIKLDATSGYFNVLQTRNLLEVSKQSVASLKAHLKNVQAQYYVGTVAKSDVLRSEVELANAEQNLIKAQNAYDLAISSLNNVIGLPLDSEIAIKDDLKYTKYNTSLDDSIKYALNNRPDAAQAKLAVDYAKQGVRVANSGNKPTVSFNGNTGWSDKDFPGTEDNTWSLSVAASWNIFDSGATKAKVKQADFGVNKANEQTKQTLDNIQLEVRQAYLNMNEAEKRIDTSQVAVDKAEEDFKIAQVRYGAGVGTNLDVIDAQLALTQAKTNYIQAMYDYNTSKAKLEKAMGVAVK